MYSETANAALDLRGLMYSLCDVAFTLKIVTGADAGKTFSFDGNEATLGRVAENNVVIRDGAASRSHARIYEENGAVFVEDLKSANGTIVNGAGIKAPKALKTGDTVTIGDVNVEVEVIANNSTVMQDPSSTLDEETMEPEDPNATLLKPPSSKPVSKSRSSGIRRQAPAPADEPLNEPSDSSTSEVKVPPPRALSPRASGKVARMAPDPDVEMSAADRMRQRRELEKSASGRVQLMWSTLSRPAKLLVGGLGGLFALIFIGGLIASVLPKDTGPKKEAPTKLSPNGRMLKDSFGYGDDITYEFVDQKAFDFVTESATRVVGVLHFQAHDISTNEVMVSLNGADLGPVPPDTIDPTREITMVVPAAQLKGREVNTIAFDNVNNPPAKDTWQVSHIWLEMIPVPEMTAEEASQQAREQMQRAEKAYGEKDIGASNMFRAWKTYRDAWLLLEATPDRPADLLNQARAQMLKIRPELDNKCNALNIEYTKAMNRNDDEAARAILKDIPNYFPTHEHPCYNFATAILKDMDGM